MRNWRWATIINVVLLIGTIVGILQPAYSSNLSLTQILLSLLHPSWTQEFLMRWLLILAFIALGYSAFIQFIFRNLPITIISTDLFIRISPNGYARMKRKQLLRANQPNVTAYFNSHAASAPTATIPTGGIVGHVYCDGWNGKGSLELRGNDKKREVMHIFSKALPYTWYMPLMPKWILNRDPSKLFKFVRRYVVTRETEVRYENEFNHEPMMNFNSTGRYQHFNLNITIEFSGQTIPSNFKVREIRNNGVTDLMHQNKSDNTVGIRVDKVSASTIRITWDAPHVS